MFIPDPNFYYPGSLIRTFPIPDPGYASKNFSILTQKIVSKLSEIWSGLFIPDPDPILTYPGSRGQKGTGPWIRNTEYEEIF